MRISSPLLLILAAITTANAAVVHTVDAIDSVNTVAHPKHKMLRVKNGAAHVNALDTAKVKLNTANLAKLDDLASAAVGRRGVDVDALGAAHAAVKTVDLKHVAAIVHTLSASLEGHTASADKILKLKDHKLAAVKSKKLLNSVEVDLAHAVFDLQGVGKSKSKSKSKKAAVSAGMRRRTVGEIEALVASVRSAKVSGTAGLVSLLGGIQVDAVLESDVVSVLAEVDVIKAVHDVANVDTVLDAVLAVPESVSLLENLQQLDSPVSFIGALIDVDSLTALVAAVPHGVKEIVKVQGAAKLVDYIDSYGYSTVARIFETVGVESVLKAVLAVPGSVQLLESIKTVVDVPALVSGLHVLNAGAFVESIKAVDDVAALTNVVVGAVGDTLSKRAELLQSVDGTLSGVKSAVDVNQVLDLVKRADLISSVGGTVAGVESAVDLEQVLGLVKRADLLSSVDGTAAGTLSGVESAVDLDQVLDLVKRSDLLQNVGGTLSGVKTAVDLSQVLELVKRADVLSTVPGSVSDVWSTLNLDHAAGSVSGLQSKLGPEQVLKLKRAIAHISALPESELVSLDQAVKRALIDQVDVSNVLDSVEVAKIGLLKRSVLDLASVVNANEVDGLVGEVVKRNVVVENENKAIDLDCILAALKRDVLPVASDISTLDLVDVLPGVKRAIGPAPLAHPMHTVNYTPLHARHSAGALLADAVTTLLPTISTLLTKLVHITDTVHVDAITLDARHRLVPLVAAVGKALDSVVSVQAPDVQGEVAKIGTLAAKAVEALP
ncbi:hypothetical protein EX895_002499 [Sporisorium graminicola]|uniref:Uncharacterized protein n=1 Tax=Sporisorium graminicola TaxID=280036 RepID=A0A4U7KV81_9BASI|nr:hypothetical protein EX895_002499 [Sporisorium graminicola]TKY88511.1 hypothetical protein EX895_002499 [Sporisorium graminicola]